MSSLIFSYDFQNIIQKKHSTLDNLTYRGCLVGRGFFSFVTLDIPALCFLASKVSDEMSADSLLKIPWKFQVTFLLLLSRFFVFERFDYNLAQSFSL